MIPPLKRPYLSFVVTARNDDHGASMLRRLQTFVNALSGQANRYNLRAELVMVEWNPPPDRPPLAEALEWPRPIGPFQVRIITVPPEIHRRYQHAEALPLYQMIAKNAGIRRAAGEFILATNIDILFSSELIQFFAAQNLQADRMYRMDRYDVESDVPVGAPPEDQLAWCRTHLLRINAREGTFALNPQGHPLHPLIDVAPPGAGISFGAGWQLPERYFGRLFRTATGEAELLVEPAALARTLRVDLEPIADSTSQPFVISVLDLPGNTVPQIQLTGRCCIRLPFPAGAARVRLHATAEGPVGRMRPSAFRVFQCEWGETQPAVSSISAEPVPSRPLARARQLAKSAALFIAEFRRREGTGRIGLPFSGSLSNRLRLENPGVSLALRPNRTNPLPAQVIPAALHTNASGDFTLAHRCHWVELRGYPEFDLYSMNLDSVFCYMAHYGGARECVLTEPMRIYHIEHAAGSGWSPEGEGLLYRRLAQKGIPWLHYDTVLGWARQMEAFQTPMIFNREDWGLGQFDLSETRPE